MKAESKESKGIDCSFIEEVETFLYMEDDVSDTLTEWASTRAKTFTDKDPRQSEQPLEHTQLHQDFCDLFEQIITKFLQERSISISQFYTMLGEEMRTAEKGKHRLPVSATFANVLLSVTDFFSFCEMMHDVACGREVIFCPPLIDCDDFENTAHTVADSKCDDDDEADAKGGAKGGAHCK
jgi:hypothetical protein